MTRSINGGRADGGRVDGNLIRGRELPAASLELSHRAAMLAMAMARLGLDGELELIDTRGQRVPAARLPAGWISHGKDVIELRGDVARLDKIRSRGKLLSEQAARRLDFPWQPALLYANQLQDATRGITFKSSEELARISASTDTGLEVAGRVPLPGARQAAGVLLSASDRAWKIDRALRRAAIVIGTASLAWPLFLHDSLLSLAPAILGLAWGIFSRHPSRPQREMEQADQLARMLEPQVERARDDLKRARLGRAG